jgi:RHS repeat-associated protein
VTNGDDSYLLLCDHLGTPLALATTDGHVVQTMQYDSFGNLLQVRGDVVRLPIGFAGGLFDADTSLTRFPWRDYDADTSRFTALDPMGEKGGDKDWYGYCVDDPVNRVDVWGLEVEFCERPNDLEWLRWTGIPHHWLKTDTYESGQGEVGRGVPGRNGDSGGLFVDTEWTDHAGQSKAPNAECWPVPNVDENCVNKLIKPGTPSGIWVPGANDCHTNTDEVLKYCRTDTE